MNRRSWYVTLTTCAPVGVAEALALLPGLGREGAAEVTASGSARLSLLVDAPDMTAALERAATLWSRVAERDLGPLRELEALLV